MSNFVRFLDPVDLTPESRFPLGTQLLTIVEINNSVYTLIAIKDTIFTMDMKMYPVGVLSFGTKLGDHRIPVGELNSWHTHLVTEESPFWEGRPHAAPFLRPPVG